MRLSDGFKLVHEVLLKKAKNQTIYKFDEEINHSAENLIIDFFLEEKL